MMLLTVHKIWCVLKWYQISLLINIKDNLYWGDHVITTKQFQILVFIQRVSFGESNSIELQTKAHMCTFKNNVNMYPVTHFLEYQGVDTSLHVSHCSSSVHDFQSVLYSFRTPIFTSLTRSKAIPVICYKLLTLSLRHFKFFSNSFFQLIFTVMKSF